MTQGHRSPNHVRVTTFKSPGYVCVCYSCVGRHSGPGSCKSFLKRERNTFVRRDMMRFVREGLDTYQDEIDALIEESREEAREYHELYGEPYYGFENSYPWRDEHPDDEVMDSDPWWYDEDDYPYHREDFQIEADEQLAREAIAFEQGVRIGHANGYLLGYRAGQRAANRAS